MGDEYNLDPPSKSRRKSLDKIKQFDDDNYVGAGGFNIENYYLPSMSLDKNKKKKKKKDINTPEFKSKNSKMYDPDEWFNELMANDIKVKCKNKKGKCGDIFGSIGENNKKKKKKDKKNEMVDYKKEFAPEASLYNGLLREQQRFTDSLQKEYDSIKSTKSTARGIGKTLTDLTANITTARSLAMQLVDKQVAIKKTAADLDMKQRKEAALAGLEDGDMGDFGATFLRKLIDQSNNGNINNNIGDLEYSNDDDIFNAMNDALINDDSYEERPEEVSAYLKYENMNVSIYVIVHNNDENDFEFIAKDKDGNIVDDYPLPTSSRISINESSGIATDNYGEKYNIIWD